MCRQDPSIHSMVLLGVVDGRVWFQHRSSVSGTVTVPKSKRASVVKTVTKFRATKKKSLNNKRKVVATIKVVIKDANAGSTVTRTVKVRLV